MSIELKIKAKHLALEPAIIRREENRLKEQITWRKKNGADFSDLEGKRNCLNHHRRWNVCNEARATHLTRMYLAGKPYKLSEPSRRADREWVFQNHILPRIVAMANKYGPATSLTQIENWSKL